MRALRFAAMVFLLALPAGCAVPARLENVGTVGMGVTGPPARAHDLGPVSPHLRVSLLLLLRDPSAGRLARTIAAAYTPGSPRFGRFATLQQIRGGGPGRREVAGVRTTLAHWGLHTHWLPGDAWLSVAGQASTVERRFNVGIHRYRAPHGRAFVAGTRDPTLPHALLPSVAAATRVETYAYLLPHDIPSGGLGPSDLLAAYDIRPLRNRGLDGSGQTVVFFEIDGFRQSDLDAYTRHFHLPSMHPIIAAGPALTPGGEAPMDLEAVHAIAPGARLVVYNLDQSRLNQQASSTGGFLSGLIGFQERIVNHSRGAIVSNSVGSCAPALGSGAAQALRQIYDRADALGESWFAASGDQGAYDCLQALEQPGDPPSDRDIGVDLPASAPGVTGVGGTRLSVRSDGSWYSEQAWEGPVETSGGGGGVSTYFARPAWQRARGVGDLALDPHGMREVPDVSAEADPGTAGAYAIGGSLVQEGGTSQAAPIWAGITALIDQYLHRNGAKPLGFANPGLYALARSSPTYPPFHDVTVGSNLVYPATPGYDMATGLGTPDAWNLARDLLTYQRGGTP